MLRFTIKENILLHKFMRELNNLFFNNSAQTNDLETQDFFRKMQKTEEY